MTVSTITCPALFLSAPASGQGKTTVTAAIARFHKNAGRTVKVFKTGPDYLDPQILEQASGQPVEMLDLWMAGIEYCRQKLYEAAEHADLILIEGAMGMFDGEPSSADLAALFGIPIVIVMDVKGMAQTAAALATGLANFRSDCTVAGLIANNCGSDRHAQLIRDALPSSLPLLAVMSRNESVRLPERHLGLVQAYEIHKEVEQCFDAASDWLEQSTGVESSLLKLPNATEFSNQHRVTLKPLLMGVRIGIARDLAFSFIYSENLKWFEQMGAKVEFFSPLKDCCLPDVDAIWLPGGYPELYAQSLSKNNAMTKAIKHFFMSDKPILAECGGMLYCMETLTDLHSQSHAMLGLIDGHSRMTGRSGCQGMQSAMLPEGEVRAHAHHRSRSEKTLEPIAFGKRPKHSAPGEAIYRSRGLTASYLHLFFPSNSAAVANMFQLSQKTLERKECG